MLPLGCVAFLLFFLSDLNDVRLRWKPLIICFPLGAATLVAATVVSCVQAQTSAPRFPVAVRLISLILGLLFLLLLVASLFFSVSADEAYIAREEGRAVTTKGLYALCRHPGVLFFIPAYLCISITFGLPFLETAVYSLLNILLIIYEDICVFPKVLSGYSEYKKSTPFLIPNKKSIIRFFTTEKNIFPRSRKTVKHKKNR